MHGDYSFMPRQIFNTYFLLSWQYFIMITRFFLVFGVHFCAVGNTNQKCFSHVQLALLMIRAMTATY